MVLHYFAKTDRRLFFNHLPPTHPLAWHVLCLFASEKSAPGFKPTTAYCTRARSTASSWSISGCGSPTSTTTEVRRSFSRKPSRRRLSSFARTNVQRTSIFCSTLIMYVSRPFVDHLEGVACLLPQLRMLQELPAVSLYQNVKNSRKKCAEGFKLHRASRLQRLRGV